MGSRGCRFIAILLVALSVLSCGKTRIIPRGEMVDIYAEMFLVDQWLRDNPDVKKTADTLLVYEPIFNRYGYTTDDYIKSVSYYMSEPDRYAKILKKTSAKLEKKEKELSDLLKKEEEKNKLHLSPVHAADTLLRRFSSPDSFYVGRPGIKVSRYFDIILGEVNPDTMFIGPRMVVWADTVSVADTSFVGPMASADTSGVTSTVIEEDDGRVIEVFQAPRRHRRDTISAKDTLTVE